MLEWPAFQGFASGQRMMLYRYLCHLCHASAFHFSGAQCGEHGGPIRRAWLGALGCSDTLQQDVILYARLHMRWRSLAGADQPLSMNSQGPGLRKLFRRSHERSSFHSIHVAQKGTLPPAPLGWCIGSTHVSSSRPKPCSYVPPGSSAPIRLCRLRVSQNQQ